MDKEHQNFFRAPGRGTAGLPKGRFEPHDVERIDDGWDREIDPVARTEIRVEKPRKIIAKNTSPDLPFDRSINPYRGCEHGCIYCFARPTHSFLNLSPGLDFETKIITRPNAAELLARELSNPRYVPKPIAIGTNTDPYQPIEKEQKIMRSVLQVLSDFNHPVMIVTKGALIERDIDILSDMAGRGLVRVGLSLTTLDAGLGRVLEPRVPAPKRTLQVIERIAGAGIPSRVMIAPVIPGLTDAEVEPILAAAANAGATRAAWIMLRLPFEVAPLFEAWLHKHRPNHAAKVLARLRDAHGGKIYEAEFGTRMRGKGVYAALIAQRFEKACKRLGLATGHEPLRSDLFSVPAQKGDQLSLF